MRARRSQPTPKTARWSPNPAGGAEQYEHGGWALKFDRGAEGFAEAWPSRTDEVGFADKMNSMGKFVVSNTLTDPEWNNSTVISGDVPTEVAKLKAQPGGVGRDPHPPP